jgi:uncharacterized protein (DUF488 family)
MLFSLGYEGLTVESFVTKLTTNRISLVIDVRLTPVSRKKGFSKTPLSRSLLTSEINYLHLPKLGNPKDNRAIFQTKEIELGRERYYKHLNNGSRQAFEDVAKFASLQRVAILCFEQDYKVCHRSCIAEQIQFEYPSIPIEHL